MRVRLIHDELNAGTLTAGDFITPVDEFFRRSHAAIPAIDAASWRLTIDGLVDRPSTFSMAELVQGFPRREVVATLMCAGLRRNELIAVGEMHGELPWGAEAVSNGRWGGVPLREVLGRVAPGAEARFVELHGLDRVERDGVQFGFAVSIPIEKAMAGEVLLATSLNDAPLSPEHGYPVRAVVPGWIGAKSVKWLGRISLRSNPSTNYFQARAYRTLRAADASNPRDISAGEALTGVALNAVITEPAPDHDVPAGVVPVRGWAIGSAGRAIRSIQVSSDEGANWAEATIVADGEPWAWTLWESSCRLAPGQHTITVRVFDDGNMAQPASLRDAWNVKGYANNAWHRVTIQVRGES